MIGPGEGAHSVSELEAHHAVHGGVDVDGEAVAGDERHAAFGLVHDFVGHDADVVDVFGVGWVWKVGCGGGDDEVGVRGVELEDGADAEQEAVEDAFANLVLDVVEGEGVDGVWVVAERGEVALVFGAHEA